MRHNPSYLQRLVAHYGTTDDPQLGGFLLPDGSFLDFSEGSGSRAQDHRNITWVLPRGWEQPRMSRWDGLVRICRVVGMYRWMPESWGINAFTAPTRAQVKAIVDLSVIRPLIVEAQQGIGRRQRRYYVQYEWTDPRGQAALDLVRFFDGGRFE